MSEKQYTVGEDLVIELHPDYYPTLKLVNRAVGVRMPVKLEDVPQLINQLDHAAQDLRAMRRRYTKVFVRQKFKPELVRIPAGEFLMGSDPGRDKDTREVEQPQHVVSLPEYFMSRTPVTNAQYAAFVRANGYRPPEHWGGEAPPLGQEDHPVTCVAWYDAIAYCRWLTSYSGEKYRLPTEAEWEKGARGTDGRFYPWGNQWDAAHCSTLEGGKRATRPVGACPDGGSPYGLLDMAGNVWEFTVSLWGKYTPVPHFGYPYEARDGREKFDASPQFQRVLRGGSFMDDRCAARCAFRHCSYPLFRNCSVGFRVVVAPHSDFEFPDLPPELWIE